jgi:hypothetical protein
MKKAEKVVFVIVMLLVLCTLAAGIFGIGLSIAQARGRTRSISGVGVGIYWDPACANQTSSIDWGLLDPGSNKTVRIYVRNEGNTSARLMKTVQNWNPTFAKSYMTLKWNYANQILSANNVLPVSLTLIVSASISRITGFSFNVTITATG